MIFTRRAIRAVVRRATAGAAFSRIFATFLTGLSGGSCGTGFFESRFHEVEICLVCFAEVGFE